MDKEKLLNKFLESHGVEVSRLSKDAEKQYKEGVVNTLGFKWFVLRKSIDDLMDGLWRAVYLVLRVKNFNIFIRNQWHAFSFDSDFDVVKIGRSLRGETIQIHISLVGFKVVFCYIKQ